MTDQSIDQPPRYLVPALGGIYAVLSPYSWPLVRVATGLFFVPHGMQKLFGFWGGDLTRTAEGFAKQGLEPAMFWATYIGNLEFFGGILLAIGLLTRPVAALFCGFMAVAAFHVHVKVGWFWTGRGLEENREPHRPSPSVRRGCTRRLTSGFTPRHVKPKCWRRKGSVSSWAKSSPEEALPG
jgi:putative oxidoreductase